MVCCTNKLTNFERFEREVNSGKLKWGFIHTDRFWIENVLKCEQPICTTALKNK